MKYKKTEQAIFKVRINRFIAQVELQGELQTVHVANTGRCRELLLPGAVVILAAADNPNRKTAYTLIGVYKGKLLINMDSQIPHQVVYEALGHGQMEGFDRPEVLKKEKTYANSRFDVYFETPECRAFMEVKGVTLEKAGVAMFPDAPTTRGARHIEELIKACQEGYRGYIVFLIQMKGVHCFMPNWETDAVFSQALFKAAHEGVQILAYDAVVQEDEIRMGKPLPVCLTRPNKDKEENTKFSC